MLRRSLACAIALAALVASPRAAEARQDSELAYPYEQVWGTAVRLLRVDYGFPIRDRDEDIGFVLFDYQDHGRTFQGSLEVIRTGSDARPGVRVVLQIPSMPSYIERMLLDRLQRKLREDFGVPVPPPSPAPPVEAPPSGDDDGEGDEPGAGQGDQAPSAPDATPREAP